MSETSTINLAIGSMPVKTAPTSVRPTEWWRADASAARESEGGPFFRVKSPDELLAWYSLCVECKPRLALERAVATFENLLRTGKRDEANTLLERANVKRLAPTVLVGILGITRHATPPLPARAKFLKDAEAQLRAELDPTRAEKLLRHRR